MSLKLKSDGTSNSVEIDAPAGLASEVSITLPAVTGGEFVVTDASGNIDLGPLDINGGAADNSVNIDSSGRLLVGTTTAVGGYTLQIEQNAGSDPFEGSILLKRGFSNAAITSAGVYLGSISAGSQTNVGGFIRFESDEAWGTGDYPTRMVFSTTPDTQNAPTERMRIESDGAARHVASDYASFARTDTATTNLVFVQFGRSASSPISYTSEGDIRTDASGNIALANASDISLKTNIRDLSDCLTTINNLHPVLFDWKEDYKPCCTDVKGFIAQEFEQVLPKSVATDEDGIKCLAPATELFPLLVGAIKELSGQVAELQAKVAALESA